MADPKLLEILRVLAGQQVELIIVGGMAAVIGGAPVITHDLDLLRRRSPQNVAGLLAALEQLDAVFRGDARRLRPNASHLTGPGHLLLSTRFGQLDLLGSIEEDTSYEDLLPDTYEVAIEELTVRVVTLERLLVIKRQLARPKDRLMALQIEATIEERSKKT
jgi:hypothetical protein